MQLPTEQNQPTEPVEQYRDAGLDDMLARVQDEVRAETQAGTRGETWEEIRDEIRDEVRDQERRRLLFELHDGIGPTLAAVALGLRAAHDAIERDTSVAGRLLGELEHEVQRGILELRRLTGCHRTSGLEQLGLLTALRRHVATLSGGLTGGIDVRLDLPDTLPPLAAPVATAAYRIGCEALAILARHADARSCTLRLSLDDELRLEIVGDGTGLPSGGPVGARLRSIRDSARGLGGDCHLEATATGSGIRVVVRLPLHRAGG